MAHLRRAAASTGGATTWGDAGASVTVAAPTGTGQAPMGTVAEVPRTLPLVTGTGDAHMSRVSPILSGVGFGAALLIVVGRLVATRSGRASRL